MEFSSLTARKSTVVCEGRERVTNRIARSIDVGARTIIDQGCNEGIERIGAASFLITTKEVQMSFTALGSTIESHEYNFWIASGCALSKTTNLCVLSRPALGFVSPEICLSTLVVVSRSTPN